MKKSILSALIWMISLLPFWALYILSDFIFILIYHVFGYRKKVVFKNLRNSFPEKTEEEIKSIAYKFYRYLPDIIVEALKMRSISKQQLSDRIDMQHKDEIQKHFDNGKSIILVTSHYCNWELGTHWISLLTENPKLIIYKPLNDKDFDQIQNKIRTRFGATMVPMKQILRHIAKLKNQNYISVFAADQTPVYQNSDYYLEFLNQDTLVYTGVERIAKLTNNPVVFCHIGRQAKRGYYFCKFTTLVEDPSVCEPYEITHIHNKFTEDIIKDNPPYWLWSHNRWKRQREIIE